MTEDDEDDTDDDDVVDGVGGFQRRQHHRKNSQSLSPSSKSGKPPAVLPENVAQWLNTRPLIQSSRVQIEEKIKGFGTGVFLHWFLMRVALLSQLVSSYTLIIDVLNLFTFTSFSDLVSML